MSPRIHPETLRTPVAFLWKFIVHDSEIPAVFDPVLLLSTVLMFVFLVVVRHFLCHRCTVLAYT